MNTAKRLEFDLAGKVYDIEVIPTNGNLTIKFIRNTYPSPRGKSDDNDITIKIDGEVGTALLNTLDISISHNVFCEDLAFEGKEYATQCRL